MNMVRNLKTKLTLLKETLTAQKHSVCSCTDKSRNRMQGLKIEAEPPVSSARCMATTYTVVKFRI